MTGKHRVSDLPAPPWPLVQREAPPQAHGKHIAAFVRPGDRTSALWALIPRQRRGEQS